MKRKTTEQFIKHVLKQEEMENTILKEGDIVELLSIKYTVRKPEEKWYLNNSYFLASNDEIFIKLGLDKIDFQRKILGYYELGGFPECKTSEDLTKFVNAIQEEILKQEKQKQMKKISINLSFLQEGFKAMNPEQQKLVRENVDGFTGETTEDFIKQYYENNCCGFWKQRMEKEFPFLKTKEIDLSKDGVDGLAFFRKDGYKANSMIAVRSGLEYVNKAFYLNDEFGWEIKKDSNDYLCLIPTRKK